MIYPTLGNQASFMGNVLGLSFYFHDSAASTARASQGRAVERVLERNATWVVITSNHPDCGSVGDSQAVDLKLL